VFAATYSSTDDLRQSIAVAPKSSTIRCCLADNVAEHLSAKSSADLHGNMADATCPGMNEYRLAGVHLGAINQRGLLLHQSTAWLDRVAGVFWLQR
jgi:hypothetical protein